MIERSSDAWEHSQFKDVIVRVANVEMYVAPFGFLIRVLIFGMPQLLQSSHLLLTRAAPTLGGSPECHDFSHRSRSCCAHVPSNRPHSSYSLISHRRSKGMVLETPNLHMMPI